MNNNAKIQAVLGCKPPPNQSKYNHYIMIGLGYCLTSVHALPLYYIFHRSIMSKRFQLVSGVKHRGGYRVLMSGGNLSGFLANPIMLWMHQRSPQHRPEDGNTLPIGVWEEVQHTEEGVYATANIDMENAFSAEIGRKVENGISKWDLLEGSIVDIPMDSQCTIQCMLADAEGNMKPVSSIQELKQAFPTNTNTNNQTIDNTMTEQQFDDLKQAIQDLTKGQEKLAQDIADLKQATPPPANNEPVPPAAVPSIADELRQRNQQATNEVKDFDWYAKNDADALGRMKADKPEQYKSLCQAAGIRPDMSR
jgi:hypothetical protein